MPFFILFLSIFLACQAPQNSHGAFKRNTDQVFNISGPKQQKLPDDVILLMPFTGEMILRPVEVPVSELLRDKTFAMGINNSQNQDRQIYERQFMGHIAAPFTAADLPPKWVDQMIAPHFKPEGKTWYFMGKYEVTRGQWFQVMDGLTSAGEKKKDYQASDIINPGLPITNVNWFDAQDFLHRYNNWLIKNHGKDLPIFRGTRSIAFLRLPTEEEWEYAARGGAKVPPEWWEEQDFYPMQAGKSVKDYAIYNEPRVWEKPFPVGSRLPNPLGLYDTSGNAREMVHGFFHMSIPDMRDDRLERRLHGAAGGVIIKGGGFRSFQDAVMPGSREEMPPYTVDGAVDASDLGFRVVLAGINFPGGERLAELKKKSGVISNAANCLDKKLALSEDMSASQMLSALSSRATGEMKSNLEKIRLKLDDQINVEKSRDLKNLENTYRFLLYQAETLRAFAFRYWIGTGYVKDIRNLLNEKLDPASKKDAENYLAQVEKDLSDFLQAIQMGVSHYKASLGTIYNQDADELRRLGRQAMGEYGGLGAFNEHMRQNIDVLEKNLDTVRRKGMKALSTQAILKMVLPEKFYQALPDKGES